MSNERSDELSNEHAQRETKQQSAQAEHTTGQNDQAQANRRRHNGRQTRWNAKQLAIMAVFIALSALLSFIPLPIWPPASLFGITYDASNVPPMIGGLIYGAGSGSIIVLLAAFVHGIISADIVGTLINIVAGLAFILPAALVCHKKKTTVRLVVGLLVGAFVSVALIIPANLIIWPQFFGMPFEETLTYVIPLMLPFNIFKALLNAVLSFILFKSLHKVLNRYV